MLVKPRTCVGASGREEPVQFHTAVGYTMVYQRICKMTCHWLCPCQVWALVMLFAKEAMVALWRGEGGIGADFEAESGKTQPPTSLIAGVISRGVQLGGPVCFSKEWHLLGRILWLKTKGDRAPVSRSSCPYLVHS